MTADSDIGVSISSVPRYVDVPRTLDGRTAMTVITRTEAAERAATGAAVLDKLNPGWAQRIDTRTLSLASPASCVIGQLYGFFALHYTKVFENEKAAEAGGVVIRKWTALSPEEYHDVMVSYDHLTDAWRDLVENRCSISADFELVA